MRNHFVRSLKAGAAGISLIATGSSWMAFLNSLNLFKEESAEAQTISPNVGAQSPGEMPGRAHSNYGQVPAQRMLPNSAPIGDFWTSPGVEIFTGKLQAHLSTYQAPCPSISVASGDQQAGIAASEQKSDTDSALRQTTLPECNAGIVLPVRPK